MATVAAYIPCFNNGGSIKEAIASLAGQSRVPDEIVVVDDGSTDDSAAIAGAAGVRVIRLGMNCGRGVARRRAMEELASEFVLSCDATTILPSHYLGQALERFEDQSLAAVYGRLVQAPGGNAVRRWRGRHLLKGEAPFQVRQIVDSLSTCGAVVRRDAVMSVGNFDPLLRRAEDADLARRLRAAGWRICFNPKLEVMANTDNTLGQVLERYWRWNDDPGGGPSFGGYLRDILFSLRVMVVHDLRTADLPAACISLICPHYRFWRTLTTRWRR